MRSITIYYYTNSPASKHILVALREADKETRLLILESMGRAFGGLKLFKGLRDGQESYAVLSISTCKAVTDFLLIALTLGLLESFALKSHLSTNPICRVLGAGRIEIVAARVPENPKTRKLCNLSCADASNSMDLFLSWDGVPNLWITAWPTLTKFSSVFM
jgi:hypothetical protein